MSLATVEFTVQMKCRSCADNIKASLSKQEGVHKVDVIFEKGIVLVDTNLSSSIIKDKLESAGYLAVLSGYGKQLETRDNGNIKSTSCAVAMLGGSVGYSPSKIHGVVRFVQTDDTCIVDGTIDGLTPGYHGLHIHECGDISRGCDSVGDHFDINGSGKHGGPGDENINRHTGDLGNIEADNTGRAIFRIQDKLVNVCDIIGRSIVVTERQDDLGKGDNPLSLINGNSGTRLACGIISRSAGLFENTKKICACDGVTIWDERNRPLAGPGRRAADMLHAQEPQQECSAI